MNNEFKRQFFKAMDKIVRQESNAPASEDEHKGMYYTSLYLTFMFEEMGERVKDELEVGDAMRLEQETMDGKYTIDITKVESKR